MEFKTRLNVPSINDILEMCKQECESHKLSVLIYTIPGHLDYKWREIDSLLHRIDASQCKIAHKWALTFLNGDFGAFEDDERGGKHNDGLYGLFLELEIQAKTFGPEACSRESAYFATTDLAKYLNEKFYEITQTFKVTDSLVRSAESCHLDLRR